MTGGVRDGLITMAFGLAFAVTAALNGKWDYASLVDAEKPPIFTEVDRQRDQDERVVRRGAQRFRTYCLAVLATLMLGSGVVQFLIAAWSG